MGIFIRCTKCKSDHKLGSKVCSKCGGSLSANRRKYKVAVTHDGKRIVRHVDTLDLAKRVESSLKGKIAEKKLLNYEQAPLISDVWEDYIGWAKNNKKSWYDDKVRWDKHVARHIDGKRMDQVSPHNIERIILDMEQDPARKNREHAPATKKHVLVLIKRVYNWAIKRELYSGSNPASKIEPPRVQNKVTECLTKDELKRLLSVLDEWQNQLAALIVKFTLFTGLRQGEIMGLEWKDIDMKNGFVSVLDPKGKPATLPLNRKAVEILEMAREVQPAKDCPYVFPNSHGERRVSFFKIWSRIRAAATLPDNFRFHGLRHTFASYLASSGDVDIYTLQKLLNHQSPEMTQRYAHLLDETLRNGVNVADKVFAVSDD